MDVTAEIAVVVSVPLSLLLLLATLVGIALWWRRHKRKQSLPDERDSGTDIEMVCITKSTTVLHLRPSHRHLHADLAVARA